MRCGWDAFLSVLPEQLRSRVDALGRDSLQELRLRMHAPPELVFPAQCQWLNVKTEEKDLNYVLNAASQYSPWTMESISSGYLTIRGGHRIGICGEAVTENGRVKTIKQVSGLCIRIARDFPGIGQKLRGQKDSLLVIGAPGWGKTTLLRDAARQIAETETVGVVDERKELFPQGFLRGKRMDVLTGCPKPLGIGMLLKTMGPQWIAVDEITLEEDCQALRSAAACGVRFLATAHAGSLEEFRKRKIYGPLLEEGVFSTAAVLHKDKSYHLERMFP